jgi:hypothetical protein
LRDRTLHGRAGLLAPALSSYPFLPKYVEGESPNFAITEFYEVRREG